MKIASNRTSAFSLIEITMAIGIIAFAFVAVFGLIPVGLNNFREATDYNITSQIAQHIATDFQTNNMLGHWNPNFTEYGNQSIKYDDYGEEDWQNGIYVVNAIVTGTTLPAATSVTDPNLKQVVIQVARNPSGSLLAKDDRKLFTGALKSNPERKDAVKVYSYVYYIAKTDA